MAREGTWIKAIERTAYNERTFPQAPGINKSAVSGEALAPGRWRTRANGRLHAFQSSRAQYRNVRPTTGRDEDHRDGRIHPEYDDPTNAMAARASTKRQRALVQAVRVYLSECDREAKLGDVPSARLERLAREIRQAGELLAGVTTGDVDTAVLVGREAVRIAS